MKYGSVCSGIEAPGVAWAPLGWRLAFLSETDPFARLVCARHYPDVPMRGDFREIQPGDHDAIELLVGGTPCQTFSIFGGRTGMDDERGQLALEFCRLAGRLRPRWLVWENVPGVLSQDAGAAFGAFLSGLSDRGYGLAYRVLDAQSVRTDGFPRGVPQQRRRVYVVGHSGADWQRPAAVLFERASLCRDVETSARAWARGATDAQRGADDHQRQWAFGGNKWSGPREIATACRARGDAGHFDLESETFVFHRCERLGWRARRLTPVEFERLQGFPDNYTAITFRGKPAADGHRYKAIGNAMPVNVMRWIGTRIAQVDALGT